MTIVSKLRMSMVAAFAVVVATIALMAGSGVALAIGGDINLDTVKSGETYTTIYYPAKADADLDVWNLYSGKNKAISSVKSSNKKVATVKLAKGKKSMNVTFKKAGKAKITYKYKGKKYAVTFVTVKYAKPVKSLMVGKTQYASALAKRPVSELGMTGGTLKVKAASGWAFHSATYYNGKTGATKSIKNGKKVPASADYVEVAMRHKKSGAIAYMTVA